MKRVDELPRSEVEAKYPWGELFDGSVWLLVPGEDFTCKTKSFRELCFRHARAQDGVARTRITDDGLYIQFVSNDSGAA